MKILQDKYEVKTTKGHPFTVQVPGSKSITNRALLIAALANGKSTLQNVLFSDDSRHFLQALIDLGFSVEINEQDAEVTIEGAGGKIPSGNKNKALSGCDATINVGSAGTAARFLTAYLGLSEGIYEVQSSEQMKKRPMKELLAALEELGAEIRFEEQPYHFPFRIGNRGRKKNEVTIDVDKSSQFLSALLIVSVLLSQDFVIHVTGNHGMAYVEMTIAMMEQFGVTVQREGKTFRISGSASYTARNYKIEPDISAASYFYAMCPILKTDVKVEGVHKESLQGDIAFLHLLEEMGCVAKEEKDGIHMYPPADGKLHGGIYDLSAFSDQALTLAAISCFADAPVTICGIGHIRYQECDRINAIVKNLSHMGIYVEQTQEDAVMINPGKPHGCLIETFEDHRVAMAFSIPGLVTKGIIIENPQCCKKTYEDFFKVLEKVVY